MKSKDEDIDSLLAQLQGHAKKRTAPSPPKSANDAEGAGSAEDVHSGAPDRVGVDPPPRRVAKGQKSEKEVRVELEKRLESLGIRLDSRYEHTFGCLACKDTGFQLYEKPDPIDTMITYSKLCDECTLGMKMIDARARAAEERKNKRKVRNTRNAMTQAAGEPEEGVDSSWPPKMTQNDIPF